jgi:hypothetical protein
LEWAWWFLQEQYYWRWKMGPSVLTAEQEKEKAAKPGSDFKECATACPDHGRGARPQEKLSA